MSEYIWEIPGLDENLIHELMKAATISRATALVLANRGVSPKDADEFLHPQLQNLSDPYLLPGTKDAAKRIWEAIGNNEKILIHGDYDTDGITASALMGWVLRENGAIIDIFLPHRIDDGYGLTVDSIEKAVKDGYHLIITVDCGITSGDALKVAIDNSVDVIITDHHEPNDLDIVATAVVDPKLIGAPKGTIGLAGVGVSFKVAHAFIKYGRENNLGAFDTDLRQVLDLVALGTVADIVPLLDENRTLVKFGLEILSKQQRPGVHALCKAASVGDELRSSDITFRLAPRLNAAGRMGDPHESLQLLEATSIIEAVSLARMLDQHNRDRQQIEECAINAAEQQIVNRCNLDDDRTIVVWGEDWHPGVLGIVASRLVRRYNRPCIVLAKDNNGQYSGSGRSIKNLNLVELLSGCSVHLVRYGGHAMAAGVCLEPANLAEFIEDFEKAVKQFFGSDPIQAELEICGEIPFADITDHFFDELELLEPFGHSNREPMFVTHGVKIVQGDSVGRNHTRGLLHDESGETINFIAFNRSLDSFPDGEWSLVYTPQINYFGGRATPQVRIVDIRKS